MNAHPSRKIFVSYRRADNADFVERIRDWFVMRYGRENVFMDFDNIPPFTRFPDFIRGKVRECDVLIAIIGPRWLDLLRERMNSDEEDYVQMEIRLALEEGKLIAPICIKSAETPHMYDLPLELQPMLLYNVAYLDSGRAFLDNIQSVMDAVEVQLDSFTAMLTPKKTKPVFTILDAIANFQKAADESDWYTALDWLMRIKESSYVPRFYPIEDYEREVREAIQREEGQRDYAIIRMMAERSRLGRENSARVWNALQMFWEAYPGYDPDDLAGTFRPQPQEPVQDEDDEAEAPLPDVDVSALDQPVDNREADDMFALDTLDEIEAPVENGVISLEDAEGMGITFDFQN